MLVRYIKLAILLLTIGGIILLYLDLDYRFKSIQSEPKIDNEPIDAKTIRAILKSRYPSANIIIMDKYYYGININDFKKLVLADKTDRHTYIPEEYDCDDFAFDLWRNITRHYHIPLGVAFIVRDYSLHAVNIFIDKQMNVYLIEPQSDELIQSQYIWRILI